MVKAEVKWGKESYNVDIDVADSVQTFKTQLWTLTGVPVERQKLMSKKGGWKGILKDDQEFSKLGLQDGVQIMLVGSAEVVQAAKEEVRFVEDMKIEDLAKSGAVLPAGLQNLGNTCYMNSTLQCLRRVPELRDALQTFRPLGGMGADLSPAFAAALKDTYDRLDRSTDALPPMAFLQMLQQLFPQFAQRGPRGALMQQDAEELYSSLVATLARNLTELPSIRYNAGDKVMYAAQEGVEQEATVVKAHYEAAPPYFTIKVKGAETEKQTTLERLRKPSALPDLGGASNVVDALFGMVTEERLQCSEAEAEAEPVKVTEDLARKLVCNIQGGAGQTTQINHLHEGLKLGLTGEVEKYSDVLGRNAVWSKTVRIKRLPRYICVQFMRFFWKATPDSRDHTGVKCKIMRPITFPPVLDMFEFCAESLQAVLKVPRDKEAAATLADEARKKAEAEAKAKEAKEAAAPAAGAANGKPAAAAAAAAAEDKAPQDGAAADAAGTSAAAAAAAAPMEVEDDEDAAALNAAMAMSMGDDSAAAAVVAAAAEPAVSTAAGAAGPGLPANFKGNYELFAVVTHKGREADGGHYMAWVRKDGDKWYVFDDDMVSEVTTEEVMQLKGGGDWHMAYLTFYRYKN